MQIKYKGNIIEAEKGIKIKDLLKEKIENENPNIIACRFNNEVKSLNHEIKEDGEVELLSIGTKQGMRVYRKGLIYIVTKAFQELYPKTFFTVNYQLHHALFCELENVEVTDEMISKVNNRVREIIEKDLPIVKKTITKEEAKIFYEKETTLKGKLQLDRDDKKGVTLYYCEDYYNYFYGVLPTSTGYMKYYELMKYNDGFLVRFPSSKTPTIIEEFKDSPKLLETLDEYEDVHKILDINTVYKLNQVIKDGKIKDYILLDEALHEKKIAKISDDIVENKKIKVILIARTIIIWQNYFCKKARNRA